MKLVADFGRVVDDRAAAAMTWLFNRCHVGFLGREMRDDATSCSVEGGPEAAVVVGVAPKAGRDRTNAVVWVIPN